MHCVINEKQTRLAQLNQITPYLYHTKSEIENESILHDPI